MEILQTIKKRYDVIGHRHTTLEHLPKEPWVNTNRNVCTFVFTAALFTATKKLNRLRCILRGQRLIAPGSE